jgi:hypothetical protein
VVIQVPAWIDDVREAAGSIPARTVLIQAMVDLGNRVRPHNKSDCKGRCLGQLSSLEFSPMHVEINTKDKCDATVWAENQPGQEVPCSKPAIVSIVNLTGFAEFLCREHAQTLLESLKTIVENSEMTT